MRAQSAAKFVVVMTLKLLDVAGSGLGRRAGGLRCGLRVVAGARGRVQCRQGEHYQQRPPDQSLVKPLQLNTSKTVNPLSARPRLACDPGPAWRGAALPNMICSINTYDMLSHYCRQLRDVRLNVWALVGCSRYAVGAAVTRLRRPVLRSPTGQAVDELICNLNIGHIRERDRAYGKSKEC